LVDKPAYKGSPSGYRSAAGLSTKFHSLIDYHYSLCIEGCPMDNYITEKFTDAILCWCIPIYYGASNVADYFPTDSYYTVDITTPDFPDQVKSIAERPITKVNIRALQQARELILNKYNIWNLIYENLHRSANEPY